MFPVRSSVYFAAVAVLFGMVECGCYNRLSSFVAPAACAPVCAPAYPPACAPVCAPAYPPACAPYPTAYPVSYVAPAPQCVSPYYDIGQLYAVTKALDCSCGNNCNNSCLNVDQLLNKLVNALVYTTSEGGKGSGSTGSSGSDPLISLDLLSKLTSAGGGLGLANLGLGGTDVLGVSLGKVLD